MDVPRCMLLMLLGCKRQDVSKWAGAPHGDTRCGPHGNGEQIRLLKWPLRPLLPVRRPIPGLSS